MAYLNGVEGWGTEFYAKVTYQGATVDAAGSRLDCVSDAARDYMRTGNCPMIYNSETGKRDRRAECDALQLAATLKAESEMARAARY